MSQELDTESTLREELDIPDENPWRDKDVIRELYIEREMSLNEVADVLDGSSRNISKWVKQHGFETRSISEAKRNPYRVPYYTGTTGHETWSPLAGIAMVHRLQAVAEFGLDEVVDNQVHHINEIPWDNRPENLEVMSQAEHTVHHKRKVTGRDRVRVAELYENGDCSYRVVHEQTDYDVAKGTIRAIHKEFYGGNAA